ncbi:SPW repeat protein [Natrinema salsiterrestre]|uniref:SPW repeat protein n=1 Tax=Natrinema salsiterrestre TaxID=2950540 RepID=A0A9Q4L0I6_9EURY|nr:SPW repeat protein [Natrinema salsiterrestre]MDF9745284.1 SPW repeat protein [Natrinema salsiterrestre]
MSESTTNDPTTGESHTHDQGEPEGQKWLSGIVSLIGLWIAVSPVFYDQAASMLWNNVLIGAAIFLLAGYNYYRISDGHSTSTGVMSLVALLALWTAVSHFAVGGDIAMSGLEVAGEGLAWSNVVSGLIAAAVSAYVAYTAGREVPRGTAAGT